MIIETDPITNCLLSEVRLNTAVEAMKFVQSSIAGLKSIEEVKRHLQSVITALEEERKGPFTEIISQTGF